jgi:16S rRNA (guanine966-N2)-methyltransferase
MLRRGDDWWLLWCSFACQDEQRFVPTGFFMPIRISGNRLIKTLPGDETRPTAARVREALFNIWRGEIQGCRWLDLCAGSGSMGAEALCHGAQLVVGLDRTPDACNLIRENWQRLAKPDQRFEVRRLDLPSGLDRLGKGASFDRIYFDPPYTSDLYGPVLDRLLQGDLLAPDGQIAIEHNPHRTPRIPSGYSADRTRVYGSCALTLLSRAVESPSDTPSES